MEDAYVGKLMAMLEVITRLLAHQVAIGHENLETKAVALSSTGLKPKEIAALLGTTSNSVRVALAVAKRKKKKKR